MPAVSSHELDKRPASNASASSADLFGGDDRSDSDIESDDLPRDVADPLRRHGLDAVRVLRVLIIPDTISLVERHGAAARSCALERNLMRSDQIALRPLQLARGDVRLEDLFQLLADAALGD